jgi:ATP-binding cassette, subfamily B, bacterial
MKNNKTPHIILKEVSFSLISEGKSLRIRADGYSMHPAIPPGSTVIIDPAGDPENLRVGDVIAYRRDSGFVVHRLIEIRQAGDTTLYVTRGDSCSREDNPVSSGMIAGIVTGIETKKGQVPPKNVRVHYLRNRLIVKIIQLRKRLGRLGSKKILFRKAIKLVWESAPRWATANIFISVLLSIFPLLLVYLIKRLVDGITLAAAQGGGMDAGLILWPVIAVVIIVFLDEGISSLGNLVRTRQSFSLEAYMHKLLHAKSTQLDLQHFENPEYYDALARAAREAPYRPNSIVNNLLAIGRGLLSLLLMAGLLVSLHWGIILVLVAASIPAIWLRLHYAGVLYNFRRKQTPAARKTAYFKWLLTGERPSRELRLFGLGEYFTSLFNWNFKKLKDEETDIIRRRTFIELITGIFKAAAFLLALLYIARETINTRISIGDMAMYLVAFRQSMTYIKSVFSSTASLYEDTLFISDAFEFLDLKEQVTAVEPVTEPGTFDSSINVSNLSFTYPGNNKPLLNNLNLTINKGETIALVGDNGAGKSTLVRLLCRLYDPAEGEITMDGKNIIHMDPASYRRLFSVIFQDFMLYNLSAGDNIRMGNIFDSSDMEKIKLSASHAGIDDFIEKLPKGYDTVIGRLFDDSRELSWGEWQKIAMARALYRDAPVLILDEPTSSLDASTEYELFRRFSEITRGRTSILITHRFSNVSLADRILVLDKGIIAEEGSHDELMKAGGIYSKMYKMQSSGYKS